jgi:hypothetical protein
MTNQIDAGDRLIEALNEDGVDCSIRTLIEAMGEAGLVFAEGSQAPTIAALDEMDAE